MADYSDLIRRNLGEARCDEICQQFDLVAADRELMDELLTHLKPDHSVQDIAAMCETLSERPNLGRVIQALRVMAREAAQVSELRRLGRDN